MFNKKVCGIVPYRFCKSGIPKYSTQNRIAGNVSHNIVELDCLLIQLASTLNSY